mmetsp:Transcript_1241/g.2708  ORF Transcript_1241/g.2708 Transcript_1241/m.2708 type:complete len:94 (-) Transcript_1241:920-1201(-)
MCDVHDDDDDDDSAWSLGRRCSSENACVISSSTSSHHPNRILPSHTRDLQNGGIESVNEMRTPHTTRTQATCSLRRRSVQVQYTVEAMGADLM